MQSALVIIASPCYAHCGKPTVTGAKMRLARLHSAYSRATRLGRYSNSLTWIRRRSSLGVTADQSVSWFDEGLSSSNVKKNYDAVIVLAGDLITSQHSTRYICNQTGRSMSLYRGIDKRIMSHASHRIMLNLHRQCQYCKSASFDMVLVWL